MIRSFRGKETEKLFNDEVVPHFRAVERVARRKLMQLDAAPRLTDLRVPPGNRLQALHGNRAGQYSIRINNQWRICFQWHRRSAYNVEIVDYH